MSICCVSWFLLSITVLLHLVTTALGDVKYALEFTDSVLNCPDFENKYVKADSILLGITPGEGDEPDIFGMNGYLELNDALTSDHDINLEVCKSTELACEPMFTAEMGLCKSMEKDDAPWMPVFEMMNVTCCPIEAGSYPIKNLVISTEPFEDCINHNFVGNYEITIQMIDKTSLKPISCYKIFMELIEKQTDD